MTNTAEAIARRTSEKDFMQALLDVATVLRWRVYHTFDSRRSLGGFPDLCMVRKERLIFAELKRVGMKATPEQQDWLRDLHTVGFVSGQPEVYLWTPLDWQTIKEVLA